jgi:hypothetical protein
VSEVVRFCSIIGVKTSLHNYFAILRKWKYNRSWNSYWPTKKRAEADWDELKAKMDSNQMKMEAIQEEAEARMVKFEEKMDEYHKKRMAMVDVHHKSIMACLGQMKANTEKTVVDPEMMQSAEEHQEIPTQEAAYGPKFGSREPQKRKDRTQGIHGSRRKVSCHARVAWQKKNITRKIRIQVNSESSKDFAVDEMRKGPGCENGIRRWDVNELPHLMTGRKTATTIGGQNKREQP